MSTKPKNEGRARLTVAIAAVAVAVLSLTIYFQFTTDRGCTVEGAALIEETDDALIVRCLSPDVSVSLNGFSGRVEFTNCFRNAALQGFDGETIRENATIRVDVDSGTDELRLVAPEATSVRFAVVGDSQGHNDMLSQILASAQDCEFIVHCGDLTPSSNHTEFAALMETLNASDIPVLTTPGNHDARGSDLDEYTSTLGPSAYSFTYSDITFAFVDSSDLNVSEEEIAWLRQAFDGADRKVIVTHGTTYDPFTYNHTLDPASCDRLQQFALEEGVTAVLSGHVHAYYLLTVEGTDFMITGGGGGSLDDGVHHHVEVSTGDGTDGFTYEKVDLVTNVTQAPFIVLKGRAGETTNITFDELMAMDLLTASSSYENLYGNIGGAGTYSGPTVAALLDLVGGMVDGDTLRIASSDGYSQEFGYLNAYTDTEWLALQGEMIVALEYDGLAVPDWTEGPRLAFLPDDGLYSNLDCELTSYPGQGWWEYPSAGGRWVKNISTIEVVAGA